MLNIIIIFNVINIRGRILQIEWGLNEKSLIWEFLDMLKELEYSKCDWSKLQFSSGKWYELRTESKLGLSGGMSWKNIIEYYNRIE